MESLEQYNVLKPKKGPSRFDHSKNETIEL